MTRFLSILLPAFLAASTQAKELDPNLFFGAANAFSQIQPDTQKPFIRITGTKNISYRKVFSLNGLREPEFSLYPTQQSLSAKIEGRLEGNYHVHGEVSQSDIGSPEGRATLSVGNGNEELTIGDLTLSSDGNILPVPPRTKGARFTKRAGALVWQGLVSTPQGTPSTDRIVGNGTQGPYRLSFAPIVKGSESVQLTKGMKERTISANTYRMDYDLGNLTFTEDIVEEDELVQITYLRDAAPDLPSIASLKTACRITDSTSASLHLLRASDAESGLINTYSSLGVNSKSKRVRAQGELVLMHTDSRFHRIAGSNIILGTESDRFCADASYCAVGRPLAELAGSASPFNHLQGNVRWNLSMGVSVFSQYAAKADEGGSGTSTLYGFSVSLPYSSLLRCKMTHEENAHTESSRNTVILSKETNAYKISASAASGTEGSAQTRCFGSEIELGRPNLSRASASINYVTHRDRADQLSVASDISFHSEPLGSARLSYRLNRTGKEEPRRIVSAECETPEDLPVQFSGRYDMKCLSLEEKDMKAFQEVQELSGCGRIKSGGFSLSYHPRLKLSRSPELSQHRVISQWSLHRTLRLEVSGEDASYRSTGRNELGFDRRLVKAGARISPNSNVQVHFEYEMNRRRNLAVISDYESEGWRAEIVSAMGEESSLQCEVSNFSVFQSNPDSGVHARRDRAVEAKASRELAPGLTAYLLAGVRRREEPDTGYSYSPGVGFRLNTGRGTTAELSYRTTMWVGLPARDEEKARFQINAAETWLSATCDLEYRSLTRPISRTLAVSIQASLHF